MLAGESTRFTDVSGPLTLQAVVHPRLWAGRPGGRRQPGDLFRKLAELALHLGGAGRTPVELGLLPDRDGGGPEDLLVGGDVAVDPGLCVDDRPVADLGPVLDPGLSRHDDVIAGLAAPGDPDL